MPFCALLKFRDPPTSDSGMQDEAFGTVFDSSR